jgi:hypothetical protein
VTTDPAEHLLQEEADAWANYRGRRSHDPKDRERWLRAIEAVEQARKDWNPE